MRSTCIALDLDYTLSHFRGRYDGLFDIFRKRGVPDDVIGRAYDEAKSDGFTIEKLIDLVAREGAALERGPVRAEFRAWLESAITLYSDVMPFLERLRSTGSLPVAIITFGQPDYQEEKVRLLKFPYDRYVCVPEPDAKFAALLELKAAYGTPLLYVDDKASELDRIREQDPKKQIFTVRVMRPDSPYRDQPTRFKHIHISSLGELFGRVL